MRKVMHNKNRILGIVGACLFALLITLLLPGTASAAQNVENTYAVVVTTGNSAGENVSYFGLQYVDTDGYTHVEHVFPHRGGLKNSLSKVLNSSYNADERPLGRGKTNTYFFEPQYEVAEVVGLDIYCQGTQGNLYSWDVSGLRIYQVDQLIDILSNGEDNTIRFNGTQIAYLEERNGNGGITFSWTGNSLFQLRQDRESSHQLVFESVPYTMEGDYNYAVRVDFADVADAGIEQLNQSYNAMNALRDLNFGEYLAIQIEYMDIYGDSRCVTQPVVKSTISHMLVNGISGDAKIAGFAQQGDTVVFECTMPNMMEVHAVMLYTGAEANTVLTQPVASSESVAITGVSVYNSSEVSVSLPAIENSACGPEYTFSTDPLFYHTATSVEGETIAADSSHYVSMRPYEKGAVLKPSEKSEKYLIELFADSAQIMGVPDDVRVSLQYMDMAENARESEVFSVRNRAKDFYGYWPASGEDFAYTGQINRETGISFVAELSQVEHFTGVKVSVPEGSPDWQMAGFRVTRVDQLSKRFCIWEDVVSQNAASNRRYYREVEGSMVFSMNEIALIQPGRDYEIDFVSQSVQKVDDYDWRNFLYAMNYEQCTSNLGLAKSRENYTVEVQVQSGTTSLLDGYGDNGSKNRFYFLLEFENGVSGYVLANQQLSADGFRSGCTESFVVSTNYDYGELVSVHVIPDDISEESDPYDKLNIAQIRVRRNDNGSVSKEWIVQNVGWIGIDYRDEGASSSIAGQQGRMEADVSRVYPVTYSSYALNLEFRMGTGTYDASGSGGTFYGTMEGTLEYFNADGKRNQLTFDVIRAMYDYANRTPVYLTDGTTGSSGMALAIPDNSFMFRENHTDRFVVSVSDVARLGKLTLNAKSLNGGSLEITNVTAALVMEAGSLLINEQDEYMRQGKTEYLCEDTVDKVPAFNLFLPTGRNIYQEIYFTEHEAIKLDTKDNTWISTVSRVPNSRNDTLNVFVYPAEDVSGAFEIDVRAQYTDANGTVLETGAKNLTRGTDAEGKTVYSVNGLTATSMSTLNKLYIKAQSYDVVDAYMDHVIVQQIRAGVVVNTFYLDCEHRNAENEFYTIPNNARNPDVREQRVLIALGDDTEAANLVSENRDIAVALRYTTTNSNTQEFTSKYIYITDQQYQAIEAGDIIELTFHESFVKNITGVQIVASGNVKAELDMVCVDNFGVDTANETRTLLKHFSFPTGATIQNQIATLQPSEEDSVEVVDIQFVTAAADAYLESGTDAPIIMVVGYTDNQGVRRETVVKDIRNNVVSEGEAFATDSTTDIRLLLRDVASVQYLQLMPYDQDPKTTAVWKPSQIMVSVGTDGALQKANRSVDEYIYENKELDLDNEITGEMVGGEKFNLSNIIVEADVAVTNESGFYGSSHRVTSAGNKSVALTAPSAAFIRAKVNVTNTEQGYTVKAEQTDELRDISGLVTKDESGFVLQVPKNTTEQDQTYRITVSSSENDKIAIVIEVTVKKENTPVEPETPTEPTEPSTEPTEPSTKPTEPSAKPTEPSTKPTEPSTEPTEPSTKPTEPSTEPTEPSTEPTEPSTKPTEPSTEPTEPPTEATEPSTEPTEPPTEATEPSTEASEPTA